MNVDMPLNKEAKIKQTRRSPSNIFSNKINWMQYCSKQSRNLVVLVRLLLGKFSREMYEPLYTPSCGLNSIITVHL